MHVNIEENFLTARSLFYQNKPLVRNKTIGKVRLYLKKKKALSVMFEDLHITSVAKLDMMHSLKILSDLLRDVLLKICQRDLPELS